MSISKEIETIIQSLTDNNYPSQLVTVTKAYNENVCDILTSNGDVMKRVECSNKANIGTKALLTFLEGKQDKPFVILFNTGGGGGGDGLLVGSFHINENGHLIATLPHGAVNPYTINNEGHLIYNTEAI